MCANLNLIQQKNFAYTTVYKLTDRHKTICNPTGISWQSQVQLIMTPRDQLRSLSLKTNVNSTAIPNFMQKWQDNP